MEVFNSTFLETITLFPANTGMLNDHYKVMLMSKESKGELLCRRHTQKSNIWLKGAFLGLQMHFLGSYKDKLGRKPSRQNDGQRIKV